jgi:hypothetical protein
LYVALGTIVTLLSIVVTWAVARGISRPASEPTAALPVPEHSSAATSAAAPEASTIEIIDPPEPTSRSGAPPVVPIDSLPIASSRVQNPTKGVGRVLITATPGWCMVSIDGQPRGPTPLPAVNLPAGPHVVTCDAPGAKVHTMTVHAIDGVATRYRFNLGDAP